MKKQYILLCRFKNSNSYFIAHNAQLRGLGNNLFFNSETDAEDYALTLHPEFPKTPTKGDDYIIVPIDFEQDLINNETKTAKYPSFRPDEERNVPQIMFSKGFKGEWDAFSPLNPCSCSVTFFREPMDKEIIILNKLVIQLNSLLPEHLRDYPFFEKQQTQIELKNQLNYSEKLDKIIEFINNLK